MTDMIERVARAICIGIGDDPDREGVRITAYDAAAIAAVKAMRDLNEEMFDAAGFVYGADDVSPFWEAIIDAALGEQK